mmetsp:Transcript_22993/g.38820  ORF Transcript_22993/g.38820 Transcript_22993/m.38820 type:complete len:295 (+) Transcript_22993:500-1384(+)
MGFDDDLGLPCVGFGIGGRDLVCVGHAGRAQEFAQFQFVFVRCPMHVLENAAIEIPFRGAEEVGIRPFAGGVVPAHHGHFAFCAGRHVDAGKQLGIAQFVDLAPDARHNGEHFCHIVRVLGVAPRPQQVYVAAWVLSLIMPAAIDGCVVDKGPIAIDKIFKAAEGAIGVLAVMGHVIDRRCQGIVFPAQINPRPEFQTAEIQVILGERAGPKGGFKRPLGECDDFQAGRIDGMLAICFDQVVPKAHRGLQIQKRIEWMGILAWKRCFRPVSKLVASLIWVCPGFRGQIEIVGTR